VRETLVAGLGRYFAGEPTRPGILARAELGRPDPADGETARRLRARRGAELRADGSVGGASLPTMWLVHELLDLGEPATSPAVRRPVAWLAALQGRSGAFGEGCDRTRHARRLCSHFLAGFFSPAPPGQRLAPVTLPNGKVYRAEPAARFALSCLALRALLRAGEATSPAVRLHVQSLARLAEQWASWRDSFTPDAIVAGIHALALAGPEQAGAVARLSSLVASKQGPHGTWPEADFFQTLEMLRAAGSPDALRAVRRAMPALEARQRPDGTFGVTARQERALIALRAALWAERGS
jgi:hypothetical protein